MTRAETFLRVNLERLSAPTEPWVDSGRQFATPKPEKVTFEQHRARLSAGLKQQNHELPDHETTR